MHKQEVNLCCAISGLVQKHIDRLYEVGITSLPLLLSFVGPRSSALNEDLDEDEITAFRDTLRGDGENDAQDERFDGSIVSVRAMVQTAKARVPMLGSMGAAPPAPSHAASAPSAPSAPSAAATDVSDIATVSDLYEMAEKANGKKFPAASRPTYKKVKQCHDGYLRKTPYNLALAELGLEFTAHATSKKTFELAGEKFEAPDSWAQSKNSISTPEQMFALMERRNTAEVVAGCFDISRLSYKACSHEDSVLHYVHTDEHGTKTAAQIDAFASFEVGLTEIERLKTFHAKNPSVGVKGLVYIDIEVRKEVADLVLRGHTRDNAIAGIIKTRTDLYAASNIPAKSLADDVAQSTQDASATDSKRGKAKTSKASGSATDAEADKLKRMLEQKEREIANIKRGKPKGLRTGNPNVFQPHSTGAPFNGAPQQAQPGQRPSVPCPPDVCRDFNFAASGCPRAAQCRFKHACATCGVNTHGHRGNH